MGGCISCCRIKGSPTETVPSFKDNTPQLSISPPAKPPEISQDKRVVVHETVTEVLRKENQKPSSLIPPTRELKPLNVEFGPVKRRIPEKKQSPSKPRPENVPSLRKTVPTSSRRLDSLEPRIAVRRIPAKKQSLAEPRLSARRHNNNNNSGDLRSISPTVRGAKGSRRVVKEGSDSMRRMNSSRRMGLRKEGCVGRGIEEIKGVKTEGFEEKSKGLVSGESEKLVVEIAEKPRSVCEVFDESTAPSEALGDSALPPIDLENPLISLDCFIFL